MDGTQAKKSTPKSLGYRMNAEWELHEATWLAWPKNKDTWPDRITQVEEIYLAMIEALAPGEKINLLVDDLRVQEQVSRRIASRGIDTRQVCFHVLPTVDAWIRDYGPIFLTGPDGARAMTRWLYNAWGGKYLDLAGDRRVSEKMASIVRQDVFEVNFVLEGGSIDVNGRGTLLATEQCLLNPNRNPAFSKPAIEEVLSENLNASRIIWLGAGIAGDDTDGHIDDIARFVNPGTVVAACERDRSDENFAPLAENFKLLQLAKDQDGKPLTVVPLPMPGRILGSGGRLPASYANFYIGNRAVLVPVFGSPHDQTALAVLKELFPKREVVGIPSEPLVWGLGAIHCVTKEEPCTLSPSC